MYLKYSTCPPWYELTAIRVGVLVHRGHDDLLDRAVVPEVDDLGARRLEDPAHDVDRRVVSVEQARRGDEADPRGGLEGAPHGGIGTGRMIGKCGLGHVSRSSPDLSRGRAAASRAGAAPHPGASPDAARNAPPRSHREPV